MQIASRKRPFRYLYKLLLSFTMSCLVLVAITILGNKTVGDTSILLKETLKHNIESLSHINTAQYQLVNIRMMEMNLTRYKHPFTVSGAVDRIQDGTQKFDAKIHHLSNHYFKDHPKWSSSLVRIWQMYRRDLD